MRTAVFDLDGTLVDTSGDMLAGANSVFLGLGFPAPLDVEEHAAIAFAGGRAMLIKGAEICGFEWDARAYRVAYHAFLEAYGANLNCMSRIYPGVVDCLDALDAEGWKLAVCTNKPSKLAETLLVALGLRHRFGAMIGADTLPVRKPDPLALLEAIRRVDGDPSRSVLIGDTITDRRAAANAGVTCVLVTFGPVGEAVAEMEPEGLLHDFRDLPRILNGLVI